MNLEQDNIARFRELAPEYDEDPERVEMGRSVSAALLRALELDGTEKALEFGCGTGGVTLRIAPRVASITAMDSSPEMLAVLRQKCERLGQTNVILREGSAPHGLPGGQFDLVFSALALHHVGDTEALLRSLSERLLPGGRIAIADLDREDGSFHSDKRGVAHHGFSRGTIKKLLEQAGFNSIRLSTAHTVRKQDSEERMREYPIFLAVAVKAE